MNCKDFQTEVEQGIKGASFSDSADKHEHTCPPCAKFKQEYVEFSEWMSVCRKITAPKDFQFGVQRKIAVSSAAHLHNKVWSALRYVVPASATAAVLAVTIGYFQMNPLGTAELTPSASLSNNAVIQEKTANPAVVTPAPMEISSSTEVASANTNKQAPVNAVKQKTAPDVEKGGGSLDISADRVKTPETPDGIVLPKSGASNKSATLMGLAKLGAVTNIDMQVTRVLAGSAAERAGVKLGDIVESVNGNVLSINRGGQRLQVTL